MLNFYFKYISYNLNEKCKRYFIFIYFTDKLIKQKDKQLKNRY